MHEQHSKPWFAPKRFGYGTGLPVAWQGWAVLAVFFGALMLVVTELTGPARGVGILVAVICLGVVAAFKTKGGWHLRWGRRD